MESQKMSVEASELGWAPGEWKWSFEYAGKIFYKHTMIYDKEGDCGGFEYYSSDYSVKLTVWND